MPTPQSYAARLAPKPANAESKRERERYIFSYTYDIYINTFYIDIGAVDVTHAHDKRTICITYCMTLQHNPEIMAYTSLTW